MYGTIYKIVNKINGKIYIGQTLGSLRRRFNRHAIENGCPALNNAIKKYGKQNFIILPVMYANNQKELDNREIFCIKIFKSQGINGYNLTKGGNGSIKKELPGRILTEKEKNKISESLKKYFSNPKNKEKNRLSKKNRKIIICHQNNTIYPSIRKAAFDLNLKSKSKILDVLNNKRKSYKGYTFSFYKENVKYEIKEFLSQGPQNKKQIIDQNGKIYSSIKEAACAFNTKRESIRRVLVGLRKTYKNHNFFYLENKNVV